MHFRIILVIFVVCASSQISAKRIDGREAAEKSFKYLQNTLLIMHRLAKHVKSDKHRNIAINTAKDLYTNFTAMNKDFIRNATEKFDNCRALAPPVTTANFTPPTYTPKHGNDPRNELWNHRKLLTFIRKYKSNVFSELLNNLWSLVLLKTLMIIKCNSQDETLKELWHKIPEPSTIPGFENLTLKELWANQIQPSLSKNNSTEPSTVPETKVETVEKVNSQVPEPSAVPELGDVIPKESCNKPSPPPSSSVKLTEPSTVLEHESISKELWTKQTLSSLSSNESRESTAIPEVKVQTVEEVWNQFHYQLLFKRVFNIKFRFIQDNQIKRWNKIMPMLISENRDIFAKKLWDELTLSNFIARNNDDVLRELWYKLYLPLFLNEKTEYPSISFEYFFKVFPIMYHNWKTDDFVTYDKENFVED